ncbi:hypothetical protein BDZ88DRAFT_426092 [Geranomyces variabilis]|nr:hypothetical protein BDZ88DRAFT_426092 [Geranomyces variabilis]
MAPQASMCSLRVLVTMRVAWSFFTKLVQNGPGAATRTSKSLRAATAALRNFRLSRVSAVTAVSAPFNDASAERRSAETNLKQR